MGEKGAKWDLAEDAVYYSIALKTLKWAKNEI